MNKYACLALLLVCCLASAREKNPWTANLYFENDMFAGTDANYTNGIRMSWVSPDLTSYDDDERLPLWVRKMNNQLRFFHDFRTGLHRNLAITLGQRMYTPENRAATALVKDQRPYAGYLYTGVAYHTRSELQLDTIEIDLGIVGPSALAEQTQDAIHDLRGIKKWQGWDNQLNDEPALQMLYEHKRILFRQPIVWGLQHDFIGHAGASLGNVATYGNVGGEYRLGWDLPNDFGTSALRPGGDNSAPGRGDPRLSASRLPISGVHGFVSLDTRWVVRDIFLDGNTWRDSHSVDKENAVADIAAGVSFLTGRWKVSWAYVVRTREYEKQPHHQEYGSMSFSYSWY